jgi:hypothetical protein
MLIHLMIPVLLFATSGHASGNSCQTAAGLDAKSKSSVSQMLGSLQRKDKNEKCHQLWKDEVVPAVHELFKKKVPENTAALKPSDFSRLQGELDEALADYYRTKFPRKIKKWTQDFLEHEYGRRFSGKSKRVNLITGKTEMVDIPDLDHNHFIQTTSPKNAHISLEREVSLINGSWVETPTSSELQKPYAFRYPNQTFYVGQEQKVELVIPSGPDTLVRGNYSIRFDALDEPDAFLVSGGKGKDLQKLPSEKENHELSGSFDETAGNLILDVAESTKTSKWTAHATVQYLSIQLKNPCDFPSDLPCPDWDQ